jgi:hypothetical protein
MGFRLHKDSSGCSKTKLGGVGGEDNNVKREKKKTLGPIIFTDSVGRKVKISLKEAKKGSWVRAKNKNKRGQHKT